METRGAPEDVVARREWAFQQFNDQHTEAVECHASSVLFEQGEGIERDWHDRTNDTLDNARRLSEALRKGNEEQIREGHGGLLSSLHVMAGYYDTGLPIVAARYADAREILHQGRIRGVHLTAVRANMLEVVCALPRCAAALDANRTPNARQMLGKHIGDAVYYLTFAVPLANQVYELAIDPEQNFRQYTQALAVRIALQTTYGQWRDGRLSQAEAYELVTRLAEYGHGQGLDTDTLAALWIKAPSQVRDMRNHGFALPWEALLGR